MVKVAIIGFGGIAQSHRYAYWYYNKQGVPVRLVAACDTDKSKFDTITKINIPLRGEIINELPFNIYTDWREMLKKEQPDLVDICLPTKFHKDITIEALKMGFSVMCEKPMAETYTQSVEMVNAAEENNQKLMIAHCVRFYPEYEYLQKAISNNIYGKVLSSQFYRYSPIPTWSNDWRQKADKIGSCLYELNIHDVDIIMKIFGEPKSVFCDIKSNTFPYDFAESRLNYKDHNVIVKSAWFSEDAVFSVGYEVVFESGILECKGGTLCFKKHNGEISNIELDDYDGVMGEIKYFVNVLDNSLENEVNPPLDSARTLFIMEMLFESSQHGREIYINNMEV